MVSIKKMKLKKPNFLGKKSPKKETYEIDQEPSAPTKEKKALENDPIMEDREDAAEGTSAESVEEDRKHLDDNEERSPPAEDVVEEDEDEESELAKTEDDSVMTENNDADDALSTVKEEPSREEAEEKTAEEPAPTAEKEQEEGVSLEQTMDDEDFTLDATATSTVHDAGCTTPAHTSAFCGCF